MNNTAPPPPAPTTQAEFVQQQRRRRADEAALVVKEIYAAHARAGVAPSPEDIVAAAHIYAGLLVAEAQP
jgi:hypothetical protein